MLEILNSKNLPLHEMRTSQGNVLFDYSFQNPILLVFLRHFGCTFCRESVADIAKKQTSIQEKGFKIIFIHMSEKPEAKKFFKKYKIKNPEFISDPSQTYYRQFGLGKGTLKQLFGFKTWYRGFDAGVLNGHGIGRLMGDGLQMPGVFMLLDGEIKSQFIHNSVADQPNYSELMDCCIRM